MTEMSGFWHLVPATPPMVHVSMWHLAYPHRSVGLVPGIEGIADQSCRARPTCDIDALFTSPVLALEMGSEKISRGVRKNHLRKGGESGPNILLTTGRR